MLTIYHNPRCTKSRQGLEVLQQSGSEFEIVKYLENVPTKEELAKILGYLNIGAEQLIRKNEAVWKENYKGRALTEDELLEAMVKHPKLIERPIVIKDGKAVIGRPTEKITELLEG